MYIYIYIYISEGGFTPTGDISSLRTLTGLGQRSWVVVVPRPWTYRHPPPNWKITDRPGFKTVFLTKKTYFDIVFARFSAEALTFQGGPA